MSKRTETFLKLGYPEKTIVFLEKCNVTKNMLWFLNQIGKAKKELSKKLEEQIILINKHIENIGKNIFENFNEAYESALLDADSDNRMNKNIVYTFEDGYFITKLDLNDLIKEGKDMANCIGSYGKGLRDKRYAILALKNKSRRTLVHFKVLLNGSIGQNYEKANANIRNKNWKYIIEFFNNNNKNIDLSKYFGSSYEVSHENNGDLYVSCILPTSVIKSFDDYGKEEEYLNSGIKIKRFKSALPFGKQKNNFKTKQQVLNYLENLKNKTNELIDDTIKNLNITELNKLYLNDNMKEKIFGKNNFFMVGDDYTYNEIIPDIETPNEEDMLMVDDVEDLYAEENEMFVPNLPNRQRLNEFIRNRVAERRNNR